MKFIYGTCVYYGYYKKENILKHISVYNKLKETYPEHTFQMILNIMIDDKDEINRQHIIDLISHEINASTNNIKLTHNYNYGGTIAGLYDTYVYMKQYNLTDYYVMYFEEDFTATNMGFITISLELLNTHNYDYIGETTKLTQSIKIEGSRGNSKIKVSRNYNSETEYWTDGGYYFSSYEKLNKIYNKIGRFHKGNIDIKYDHAIDGIDYGEVGFPTLLKYNGFNFIGLPRKQYFIHCE